RTKRIGSGVDFFDAADVAAAFERGGEPDADDVQRLLNRHGALAEGEAVGVVVGTVPDGDLLVPAEPAAHALDAVGGDGFTVAGAAEHDAALVFAGGDGAGDRENVIRIIAGLGRMRAHVLHGV